jgi:adenylate cyclase
LLIVRLTAAAGRRRGRLIGDEVNLAARLESMCKHYGVEILLSGHMYARVEAAFLARPIDRVVAVGKTRPTDIYELVAERATATERQRRQCQDFHEVVAAYRAREFAAALRLAAAYEAAYGGDVAASKYRERCEWLLASPPGADWDCVEVLLSK